LARIAPRPDVSLPARSKSAVDNPGHRLFQEFRVQTLDDLVKQLEAEGQGIDVLTIDGVPHSFCGKPLANIFVQTDAAKHVPGDLLAIYQYCQECKLAIRVL
jgi:hypothetical protein